MFADSIFFVSWNNRCQLAEEWSVESGVASQKATAYNPRHAVFSDIVNS